MHVQHDPETDLYEHSDEVSEAYTDLKERAECEMTRTRSAGRMLRLLRVKLYLEHRYSREYPGFLGGYAI